MCCHYLGVSLSTSFAVIELKVDIFPHLNDKVHTDLPMFKIQLHIQNKQVSKFLKVVFYNGCLLDIYHFP